LLAPAKQASTLNYVPDESTEIFDDLYLGLRAGGAMRKQRRGEPLTDEEQEALGRWQRLSTWRKAAAVGAFGVGTFGLGFTLGVIYESYGPWEAFRLAGERTWEATSAIGSSLGRIVTGEGRKDVASPVGIVQASSETLEAGFREYLGILALISLSLALLNLLPLLPLDGGHIAFSIAEGVRGRAIPRAAYERASAIGILLVLFLFFIGLTNDVNRIRGG